jgi:Flp pilus assembly protein TadD
VLLHAANAVVLWWLLARLGLPGAGGWVAGAVFALHPVHVASVAWVSELKNVLSTALFLGSACWMTRWWSPGLFCSAPGGESVEAGPAKKRPGDFFSYGLGVALFAGALLSKTATCLLPAALLIAWWWKAGRIGRRELLGVAPLAVLGAVLVGVTIHLESSYGTGGESSGSSVWEKWLVGGRSAWFYAWKLLWPADLMMIYPRWAIDAGSWWQHVYPLGLVGVLGSLWALRDRLGRGPVAGAAYFVVAVVPVSLVTVAFTRFSWVADHWSYWGSMGLIASVVGGASCILSRLPRGREVGIALSCLVLATLGALTWQRARLFETPEALWRHTVAGNPLCWQAHYNLGLALVGDGRFDEAAAEYRAALELAPGEVVVHNNLGSALLGSGLHEDAIVHLEEAIALDPGHAGSHYNLGLAHAAAGRPLEAERHYREAIRLSPVYADAHQNLGVLFHQQGRVEEAIAEYEAALELEPEYELARRNLELAQAQREGR